jgi:8-oxo-dGTP pyrophosphatase MutT (NUDIX family)
MLLIVTEDNKLLLHHRDSIPGISHPGCWAGFGGAIEGDESVEEALRREMKEETGLEIEDPIFLTDEIDHEGDGSLISLFFVLGGVDPKDIDLQEGVGIGVFEVEELASLEISPFVRRAIQSHLVPKVLGRKS